MLEIRRWSCCSLGSTDQAAGCAELRHTAILENQSSHLKKKIGFQSIGLVGIVQVRTENDR